MGVRGLQGFIGSTCPQVCTVVNLRELAERHRSRHPACTPTVVVDAMCCLRYWYTPESWVCGGQWREYFSALRDFVKAFAAAGIRLVFFFDGMVEPGKREEWVTRRRKNNREIARIFQHVKARRAQPGRSMFFIPAGLAVFTRFALQGLGQETVCSLREADYEAAAYGLRPGCLGVLGEDTDYLIYDTCPYLSAGELRLERLETLMLCRAELCAALRLRPADLPLLACLLGNDVVPEGLFEGFRYRCLAAYTAAREGPERRGSAILAVADHIARVLHAHQGERPLDELLPLGAHAALFYRGLASYLLPGQQSPWLPAAPAGGASTPARLEAPQETPREAEQETPREAPQETPQEARLLADSDPALPSPAGAAPAELDARAAPEEPWNAEHEGQPRAAPALDPDILKVAREQHVRGESYLVYNVLRSGEVECSNTLEDALDQALPSQAFVFRPVRQRVYSLLLGTGADGSGACPVVKEWFVYAGNPLQQPDLVRPLQMNLPGGPPNLKLLWLGQEPEVQARRVDALLACFDLSSAREELQALEGPLQALCCLLTYLFVQVDTLTLEDLHAFLAQALCLPGWSTAQLADLELDHVDSRAVQLGALLMRGLTTLLLVNSACGSPWRAGHFMPWNLFDGKLFHQKYLQSERGYTVEELVEQNRARLTQFHALKSAVCKACAKENRRIVSGQRWRAHHTAGRWGRQGSSSYRTSSGHSRSSPGQHWRDQGPGGRPYEPDPWRRHSSSSGWSS